MDGEEESQENDAFVRENVAEDVEEDAFEGLWLETNGEFTKNLPQKSLFGGLNRNFKLFEICFSRQLFQFYKLT